MDAGASSAAAPVVPRSLQLSVAAGEAATLLEAAQLPSGPPLFADALIADLRHAQQLDELGGVANRRLARSLLYDSALRVADSLEDPAYEALKADWRDWVRQHLVPRSRQDLREFERLNQRLSEFGLPPVSDEALARLGAQREQLCEDGFCGKPSAWTALSLVARAERAAASLDKTQEEEPDLRPLISELWGRNLVRGFRLAQLAEAQTMGADPRPEWARQGHAAAALDVAFSEACADSLDQPESRAMNLEMQRSILGAHKDLVQEMGELESSPSCVLSHNGWVSHLASFNPDTGLAQNYQIAAMHLPGMGLALSPDLGERIQSNARQGRLDEELVHELIHTSQPANDGTPAIDERHELLERRLMEAVTQAETRRLMRQAAQGPRELRGSQEIKPSPYDPWAAVCEAAAETARPHDPAGFARELSGTPYNRRLETLALGLLGDDGPDAQMETLETFSPLLELVSDSQVIKKSASAEGYAQIKATMGDLIRQLHATGRNPLAE